MNEWNLFEQQPVTMNHPHYGRNKTIMAVCEYDNGIVFYPGMGGSFDGGFSNFPISRKPYFKNGNWYVHDDDTDQSLIEFTLPTPEALAWWEQNKDKDKVRPLANLAEQTRRAYNQGE